MPDCGRDIPQQNDSEIAALTANYPSTSTDFGELHDIQFPYWNACQVIATCRDIVAMLESDLEERGDVAERGGPAGSMVATMTKGGSGGWRSGNAETVGFDAAWAAQKANLEGFVETLRTLAGDLEDAWDGVVSTNSTRAENRDSYDTWMQIQEAPYNQSPGSWQ